MALVHILASLPLLLLVLPLLSLLLLGRRKGKDKSPWKLPPGPGKLPIIGDLHQLLGNTTLLHRSLWELSKKHGPLLHLKLGQLPVVVVSSAELAEEVLKTHDPQCCSRPPTISTAKLSYGFSDVAFAPHGVHWRELRKICVVELFTTKKITSFRSVREEEIQRAVELIRSRACNSAVVNLSEVLFSVIGNITCRTAFGSCGRTGGGRIQFQSVFKEAQAMFAGFFVADYIRGLGWVDTITGMQGRLQHVFLKLDAFYQQLIDEHLDPMRQRLDDSGDDVLDALLRVQKDSKNNLTDDHIKGVLMNIFIAGTDTPSSSVEWAMTELMRHPEKMKRAQDEVRGHVGSKGKVEESDLHQLEYLKCVVKETLRLHPPVPLLAPRETMQHIKLNGFDIPPKTTIYVNAWAIGRDPNSWERPDAFQPERFMEIGSSVVDHLKEAGHDFKFIPFGEGRRICPGKNVAMIMMELVLANLLYCFDWSLPAGVGKEDIDMDEAPGITVHRKSALFLMATNYGAKK